MKLSFLESGKPMQIGWIEWFDGKFVDERLNENWLTRRGEAIKLIVSELTEDAVMLF